MRLFPIPYRFLEPDKRFAKYQWIEAKIYKAIHDARPESHHIDVDSIRIASEPLSTAENWQARKQVIFPLKVQSLCSLQKSTATLGIFKPRLIEKLIVEASDDPNWTADQLALLRQVPLFKNAPKSELEKVPYDFKYKFRCDESSCKGHTLSCTDWEMGALWRKCRDSHGDQWEAKFRERYEAEMIHKNDTHFYVGTVHKYGTWIIVGVFYPRLEPPKKLDPNLSLFAAESRKQK